MAQDQDLLSEQVFALQCVTMMTEWVIHVLQELIIRFKNSRRSRDIRDLTKQGRRRQGELQKNNSARASRFFVHFFAVPVHLRREMTKF